MANNRIQVKRTSTTGRTANTTDSGNTQYITAGEFALNMADGILYSSNGSALIEIGANNTNATVTGTLTVNSISANGGVGSNGQVLTSNGTTVYWSTATGGESATIVRQQYTGNGTNTVFTVTDGYTPNNLDVYVNGVKLYNGTEVDVSSGTTFTITPAPPSGMLIEVVGVSGASPGGGGGSGTVTSIATGNGLIGGTITTSGTISVLANTGLVANTTGLHVNSTYVTSLLPQSKSLTIPSPVTADEFTLFFTNTSITLSQIRTVVLGTTPSVNATFSYGTSRATGTTIQANILTTNVTNGNTQTSFTNATVPANSFVWVTLNSVTGTVSEYHATLMY